jgi:hypothetical protein
MVPSSSRCSVVVAFVDSNATAAFEPLVADEVDKDEMTGHGFRAMARTLLAERLNIDEAVIEVHRIAHGDRDHLKFGSHESQLLDGARRAHAP